MVDAAREGSIITRVYINSVRNLYEHSMRQSDKALSYLFQMIPFIHYKYHMLCFNPLEKQRDDVIWMTVEDFADAIGFDRNHIKRLYTTLFKPDFLLNGVVCKAVAGIDTGEHTFNRVSYHCQSTPVQCRAAFDKSRGGDFIRENAEQHDLPDLAQQRKDFLDEIKGHPANFKQVSTQKINSLLKNYNDEFTRNNVEDYIICVSPFDVDVLQGISPRDIATLYNLASFSTA